ncbi:hypothetical protein BgiBS90_011156 [Biomphalaria glabrata]|nr:hypothetical protein BgiBS90_011156 [Biomphalaria glabrata]
MEASSITKITMEGSPNNMSTNCFSRGRFLSGGHSHGWCVIVKKNKSLKNFVSSLSTQEFVRNLNPNEGFNNKWFNQRVAHRIGFHFVAYVTP